MAYRGLTSTGLNYLNTRLANRLPVEFTKVKIGAGVPLGNPADVDNLVLFKEDVQILKKTQENNSVEITVQITNSSITEGFYLKEIGIFVNDNGVEKLYWYCNEDNAQYVPKKTESAIAFEIDIKMEVTNVESTILNWSGEKTWVNKEYLENQIEKTKNLLEDKGLYPRQTLSGTVNLDNIIQQGLYDCSNLDKSSFTGYDGNYYSFGTFEVLVDNAGNITQKYIPHKYTGNILIRQKYHNNIWEEWRAYESSNSIDKRIGTLPASVDTSEKIFRALQGNVGIKFDDKLLYLNDAGTKRVGYCYLDKLKDGIFECISSTTSTVNNSSYFKNISNKENSDRLDNLFKVVWDENVYLGSLEPNTVIGDIIIPNNTALLIFDMISGGVDGSVISTITQYRNTAVFDVNTPMLKTEEGSLKHVKFKLNSGKLTILKSVPCHLLRITAINIW